MKHRFLLVVLCLAIVPVSTAALDPNELSSDELNLITGKCRDVQSSLQRLQYSDPVTRVSRGNATANIIKLMSALNSRAAYNTFNIPGLVTATNNVQKLRQDFGNSYTAYEIALRDLVSIGCREKPAEFYKRLVDVRTKRAELSIQIKAIEQQLDLFGQSIQELVPLVRGQ